MLRRSIYESTYFLDNVVTANAYVPVIPEVAAAAYRARRIGLGIMGLGDMMYQLGIRYGSEEGQEFAAQVMEFVRFYSMDQSVELAKARAPFLGFAGSIYDAKQPNGMKWQPPQPQTPFTRNWQRPALDWHQLVEEIKRYGIRNAAQTTVAPTGTIATVCGCEGYGCEPVFALGYTRHFKDGDKDVELLYTSPLFEQALNAADLSEQKKQAFKQHVATYGTCQDLVDLPEHLRHAFVVSSDISAEEHVRMQAAIQSFVDNSISKTCNFAEGATEEDVAQAYMLAWELGCKGLTVYVTGSRQQVVLETAATKQKKNDEQAQPNLALNGHNGTADNAASNGQSSYTNGNGKVEARDYVAEAKPIVTKRPRPNRLQGSTYRKETPLGKAYITVNNDERNEPFEVFLNVGKAGSEVHYICSPLSASRNIYGVCYMGSSQRAFSRDEQDMLTAISFHTGSVLQALHAKGEEERTCERMIHALTLTIDARDGMTAGHSGRVASYSQSIARYLGMSQKEQRLAYYAGLLHDYGKIGVRDDILCKPSQLTPEEYEQIKQHPEYTLSILSKLKFSDGLAEVPRIASLHHERPDGKGYPRGLRRGEIPLASLVIGVADFFDALTVKRHYRDPMPFEEVLSLMEAGRDTQFDGQVLDAFKRFFYKEFLPRKKRI